MLFLESFPETKKTAFHSFIILSYSVELYYSMTDGDGPKPNCLLAALYLG